MSSPNASDRFPIEPYNSGPPVNRLPSRGPRQADPQILADVVFLEALRREILLRQWLETGVARQDEPRATAQDLRMHAWLTERLATVDYERHGLWPKVRRFLLRNRLTRWLGRQLS